VSLIVSGGEPNWIYPSGEFTKYPPRGSGVTVASSCVKGSM